LAAYGKNQKNGDISEVEKTHFFLAITDGSLKAQFRSEY